MGGLPKISYDNFIRDSAVLVTASSWETAFPHWNTQDQLRVLPWRSRLGWNVVAGVNDKIDFLDGAVVRAGTIAAANYASGALYLIAVIAAINAVTVTNTWTGSYSTSTFKPTLGHDAVGVGNLLFGTGVNLAISAHLDLGYTSTDKTGGASYVAENVSYHSREWVKFDLGSAMGADLCTVYDLLAFATGGEVRVQANATDVWTAPTFNQLLSAGSYFSADVFSTTQSFRYWRIFIDDVQNTNGYSEISYIHIGDELEISSNFLFGYTKGRQELTEVRRNNRGQTFSNINSSLHFWATQWVVTTADKDALDIALNTIKFGVKFVFIFDPDVDETNQELAYLLDPVDFIQLTPGDWSSALVLYREHGEGLV